MSYRAVIDKVLREFYCTEALTSEEIVTALDEAEYVIVPRPVINGSTFAPTHLPARRNGSATSRRSANWRPRRGAIAYQMLMAHGKALFGPGLYQGFTNDEVARAINRSPTDRGCLWHRHGDLEDNGYLRTLLDPHGEDETRPGETNEDQKVRVLTNEGVALYLEFEAQA